jgi:DNA-binding transcriptional MerR regulator
MHRMTALLSIGELANRTGLPVRTIRFYSDSGVVPPADRTDAGYRLYGPDALARLGLVRTLRDLGVDLATIRRVLEREVSLTDVAAAHAAALDAQIRVLRVQKALLGAVVRRGSDPKEIQRMHRLAQLSDDERKRIVADFLDQTFAGLDIEPGFEARMRSAAPELPDDPTPEQVDAWIELAELVQDDDFRATIRRMSEQHSAARQAGEELAPPDMQAASILVAEKAAPELAPDSPEAQAVVAEILPAFGADVDRQELADRLAVGTDARAERYWQLLAIINGWPPIPTTVPSWEWFIAALRGG